MILPFVITLKAGEVREVAISGTYLELRRADAMVDLIELSDRSGGVISKMDDAEATDFVRTQSPFESIRITNGATDQTIRFYYGIGDSGSNRFTGVVSGVVALDTATLAALEEIAIRPQPHTIGAATQAVLEANVPEVYLTPAANIKGAIFQYFEAVETSTVFTMAGHLLMKSGAAPANVADGIPMAILSVKSANINAGTTIQFEHQATLLRDVFVPAGFGVYWIQDSGTSAGVNRGYRAHVL